ncbi:unnamed protein product [Prorocentrum cordatum]|uniref:Uncharacterized protein n=1 Tax=Prorocentrum cordatum TaxID=2364126 RepID=A0ABN9XEU1_9DINO|nr:unnamed protein product [Polarella glacialis]
MGHRGHGAWQELKPTLKRFWETVTVAPAAVDPKPDAGHPAAEPLQDSEGGSPSEGSGIISTFAAFNVQFTQLHKMCTARLVDFSTSFWSALVSETVQKIVELEGLSGGVTNGSSKYWADDADDPNTFDGIQAHFAKALAKQRGISGKVKSLVAAIQGKLNSIKEEAAEHGMEANRAELAERFEKANRRSSSMLWEARAMQTIKNLKASEAVESLTNMRDTLQDASDFGEKDVNKLVSDKISELLAAALSKAK